MTTPECPAEVDEMPADEMPGDETPVNADRIWSEFIVTLNALPPQVRAAFLLHEVFEAGYDDIARLIGQAPPRCREHVEYARAQAVSRMQSLCCPAKAGSR